MSFINGLKEPERSIVLSFLPTGAVEVRTDKEIGFYLANGTLSHVVLYYLSGRRLTDEAKREILEPISGLNIDESLMPEAMKRLSQTLKGLDNQYHYELKWLTDLVE